MLASVADTIIPAGNSMGALSVGTDKYLIKIIDDCYEPEVKANAKMRFGKLNELSKWQYSKPFREGSQQERESILLSLSNSKVKEKASFINIKADDTNRLRGTQNPTLTYMALTADAVDHAVQK